MCKNYHISDSEYGMNWRKVNDKAYENIINKKECAAVFFTDEHQWVWIYINGDDERPNHVPIYDSIPNRDTADEAIESFNRWYSHWVLQDYDEDEYAKEIIERVYGDDPVPDTAWDTARRIAEKY